MNSYLRKKAEVTGFPTLSAIETTSICNLKCVMCSRAVQGSGKKHQHMDFDLFTKIIDQCAGKMELAILHSGGEPLLNKRIFEMIDMTGEAGIGAWISTNGTLLDEEAAENLLRSRLNGLVISFDGATAETYESIRVGADFEKTRANIINFINMKKKMNSGLFVTVQMIEMAENKHEVNAFRNYWSQYDVNVIVKPMIKWDVKDVDDLKFPNILCDRPWYWLNIKSDGLVPPCGHDLQRDVLYGDLNTQTVEEVWNSPAAQEFRESVKKGKKEHPVCSHCDYAPARKRGIAGNCAQTVFDMLTIAKILFLIGYNKVDRKGM